MSACNIVREENAVHVFTDGASYRGDGTLAMVGQKVWPFAHLNCAIVCRGPHVLMPALAPEISTAFASFDDMLAGIVALARSASFAISGTLARCEVGAEFELFIAGWSESRDRPESYVLASHDAHFSPWTLIDLGPVAISPFNDDLANWINANSDRHGAEASVAVNGLDLMEAQRAIKGNHAGHGPEISGVGGFCQWTMIDRNTITTAIVKRWPDEIGEPLGLEVMSLRDRMKTSPAERVDPVEV